MKSAKEMFEELGYDYSINPDDTIEIYKVWEDCECNLHHDIVVCIKNKKCIDISLEDVGIRVYKQLIEAINKQIEELGWIDE